LVAEHRALVIDERQEDGPAASEVFAEFDLAPRLVSESRVERNPVVQPLLDADLLQDLRRVARRHGSHGRLRVLRPRRDGAAQKAKGKRQKAKEEDLRTKPASPFPSAVAKACNSQTF